MNKLNIENLTLKIDSWVGDIPVELLISGTDNIRITVRSGNTGPSENQNSILSEFCSKYELLWPSIAETILKLNPEIENTEDLLFEIKSDLLMYIPGTINEKTYDFMLGYQLKKDDDNLKSSFLAFNNWEIECSFNAS